MHWHWNSPFFQNFAVLSCQGLRSEFRSGIFLHHWVTCDPIFFLFYGRHCHPSTHRTFSYDMVVLRPKPLLSAIKVYLHNITVLTEIIMEARALHSNFSSKVYYRQIFVSFYTSNSQIWFYQPTQSRERERGRAIHLHFHIVVSSSSSSSSSFNLPKHICIQYNTWCEQLSILFPHSTLSIHLQIQIWCTHAYCQA